MIKANIQLANLRFMTAIESYGRGVFLEFPRLYEAQHYELITSEIQIQIYIKIFFRTLM